MTELAPGWCIYRLGDVVENVNEYYDRSSAQPERYLAGDHIDEGSLSVERWGLTSDDVFPPTFNRRFRAGDVLFHSRNLRKLARPAFDGITGEKLFVLRVHRPDLLLPTLLPFVLQTVHFDDYVNRMWAGSTNKFLNKTPLMEYEFAVPPLLEQERMAATLTLATVLSDNYARAERALRDVIKSFARNEYVHACRTSAMLKISEAGELKMGRQKAPKYTKGECPRPFLRVVNVGELELLLDDVEEMDFAPAELERFRLQPGDILLTEGDLVGAFNVGRPALFNGEIEDCCFQNTLIRFRPTEHLSAEYSLLILEGARLSHVFATAAKTTTVTHLGLGRLAEVRIPVPPLDEQRQAAGTFLGLLGARSSFRERLQDLAGVRAHLLNEFLG
jgi:type I restriction enzyme S subunit